MNVGILTYYAVHNHGALLQAYGMQKTIEKLGYDVEFLTFVRNYDNMPAGSEKKYSLSLSGIPLYLKYLEENGIGTFGYNFKKLVTLNLFRKKALNIGEEYSQKRLDAVCIGSDEVFSIEVGINSFFYGHGLKCSNVFSYAGSFGSTTIQDIKEKDCVDLLASGFNKMTAVGVRDENSADIIKNITKKVSTLVCDPVILYGYKNEIKKAERRKAPRNSYILLYSYDKNSNNKKEIDALRKVAIKNNLKIYSVGYYHKWCDRNINVSPIDLLYYFINAEFVVTDTFHGSVLSIITNSQFVALVRNNGNKLSYLLGQYGLERCIIRNYDEVENRIEKRILYETVNKLVGQERKHSLDFLRKALGVRNDTN